jgi:hypothetical protein
MVIQEVLVVAGLSVLVVQEIHLLLVQPQGNNGGNGMHTYIQCWWWRWRWSKVQLGKPVHLVVLQVELVEQVQHLVLQEVQ